LGICVCHVAAESFAAQHDNKAVFFYRLDKDFYARDRHLAEFDCQWCALLGRNAARAAVCDIAIGIDRTKIAANRDVALLKFEANARGLKRPTADEVLKRIVAEQAQVAWAAAGTDARLDGDTAAANTLLCQCVKMGRGGRFQLGAAARFLGQSAQAVGHEQDNF